MVERAADDAGSRIDRQSRGQPAGTVAQGVTVDIAKMTSRWQADHLAILAVLAVDSADVDRRVIDRAYGDGKRAAGRATLAVADGVGDGGYGAIPIRRRREGVGTVAVEQQGADSINGCSIPCVICSAIDCKLGHTQCVPFWIAVVEKHIAHNRATVLCSCGLIVLCHRRLIGMPPSPTPCCSAGQHAAQQHRPPGKGNIMRFNFGEMKLGPLVWILPPPSNSIVVLKNQIVASRMCRVILSGATTMVTCRRGRSAFGSRMVLSRVLDKKSMNNNFLPIFKNKHQIIAASLITCHRFGCKLQHDDRWLLQRKILEIVDLATSCTFFSDDLCFHGGPLRSGESTTASTTGYGRSFHSIVRN